MNSKSFKSLLQQRAEQMAPRAEINIWPSIQDRLSSHRSILVRSNVGPKMKPSTRSLSILVPVFLSVILAVAFLTVTPQGQAFAQQVIFLFFQTAPDVRPPDQDTGPAVITPVTEINEVEDLTSWQVFKPSWLPDGFGLNQIDYRPEKGMVVQSYGYQRATGMKAGYFFLGQRKTPFTDVWPVGESARVETVQVGDVTGEYVVGAWGGAGDHLEWENNPAIQHLRWQANGYYFDIQFTIMGVEEAEFADSPYYLAKDQLISIAASLK